MNCVFLDYESYWSTTHSLSKINPIVYVMHPETEIQSVSIGINDGPIKVYFGEREVRAVLDSIDWSDAMAVAHNGSGFDHLISAWRFGIRPKAWGCTLAMSRPFYGLSVGGSLKYVARALGVGEKGSLEAVNTKGKKLADFTPDEIEKMREYNAQDTHLCREIFYKLLPKLSIHEMKLIDLCIRMTVEPEIVADRDMIVEALHDERRRKQMTLLDLAVRCGVAQAGMSPEDVIDAMRPILMSQPKFMALLQQLGAEVPMKPSPSVKNEDGTAKMIPALSKTDVGMEELLDHEDELVVAAAAARLEVKTTQLETRLQTYLDVSDALGGKLPMPVNYCGAEVSWRMSGSMGMNVQNNPRIDPREPKPADALRNSYCAPDGYVLVAVDSSNIELRVAHGLAGQEDTLVKLRNNEDLYCWFASSPAVFDRQITKADVTERYLGKQAMLQLQFQASWRSFQKTARVNSKGKVKLSQEQAENITNAWREQFYAIADKRNGAWARCEKGLWALYSGTSMVLDAVGLCIVEDGVIKTPGGHWLHYPDLRRISDPESGDAWKYGRGAKERFIYGGKVFANITQHIARLIVMEQTMQLAKHYKVVLSCHDEAVLCVPEAEAERAERIALEIFKTPPKWWPDLPITAEAGVGKRYGDCK